MKQDILTFIKIIKQICYILDSKQKKMSFLIFFLIVLGVFWETLGISAVIPFIYVLTDPNALANNKKARFIFEILGIDTISEMFFAVAIGIILIYLIKNLFLLFSAYMQARYKSIIQKNLSILMLKSFLNRSYIEAIGLNCAEVRRWTYADTDGVYNMITCLCKALSGILTVMAIGIFVVLTDPLMATGILLIGGLLSFLIVICVKKRMKEAGAKQRVADTYRDKYVNQAVYGIKEVHVMNRQNTFLKRYEEASEMKRKADCEYTFISGCSDRIIEIFFVMALILTICIRVSLGWNVKAFIPQLAAFAVAAFRILPLLSQVSSNISSMVFYRLAVEESYQNVKFYREKQMQQIEVNTSLKVKEINKGRMENDLLLENVTWRYHKNLPIIINDVTLSIKKGEAIGLIGPSGAGKSTLADIILGLLKPQEGRVLVDGIDIFTISQQWSQIVSYVPQSIYLVDDSIKTNIAFGVEKENIDDAMVWKALEMAQLDSFVRSLEDGINTIVGERGVKISGGQRQRIAIARALYFNPDIIVLDEATSALDNEKAVMESIDALQGEKTLIIVAHRLSTIKNCDKIYEVNHGKISLREYSDIVQK